MIREILGFNVSVEALLLAGGLCIVAWCIGYRAGTESVLGDIRQLTGVRKP